tara:strand:- start:3746 stop:4465 length:720 start_codon:yes stop_codon:yes gene_type:complete
VIYVNGDSHSAGADIIPGIAFAQDDPRYLGYGRKAHPEAVLQTWGYYFAQAMNRGFYCEAESGSSNNRILRTTKKLIENTAKKDELFIAIGWTSPEREEWQYGEDYIQVTASGTDSVPKSMEEEYKEWVLNQTQEELKSKELKWNQLISSFSEELIDQGIRHLFFHTSEYKAYLLEHGFSPIGTTNHFGADAHQAWADHLVPFANRRLNTHLTNHKNNCIITRVKQEFKGLRKWQPTYS